MSQDQSPRPEDQAQPAPEREDQTPGAEQAEGDTRAAEQDQAPSPEAHQQAEAQEAEEAEQPDPLAQLTAERDQLKDRLLRLAAELENYKKRSEREKAEFLKRANENLLRDLLPVVDNLERALQHAEQADKDSMLQGLELTHQELMKVLSRHGLERIEALGQPFDPERHEAMMQQEDLEAEPNTVINELQKGYLYHGRLLRPAMVVVSKRPESTEDQEEEGEGEGEVKVTVN